MPQRSVAPHAATAPVRRGAIGLAALTLLAGAALVLGPPPAAAGPEPIVIGAKDFVSSGVGWGTVRPRVLSNGGAPSGVAYRIRWTGWGTAQPRGRGVIAAYRPGGGYYAQPVTIRLKAFRIGTCDGRTRAYLRLAFSAQDRPGGDFGPWRLWSGQDSLCRYD